MAVAVGQKQYLTAFINNSATVREKAGADITNAAHKAVMYDGNGDVVIATDAAKAFGMILSDVSAIQSGTDLVTKAGVEVDVLIKYIGLLEAGGAIAKGDPVTINASGQGVTAAAGDFIFGYAYTAAANAGELAQVQITRTGKAQ